VHKVVKSIDSKVTGLLINMDF